MMLNDADKAAVDKVCAAARSCTVIVVSGRPLQIDPAQLHEIDALVAAWLPGSEGDGVATRCSAAAVHRQAAGHVAEDGRAGADQRRRRELRPAVSVRLGAADPLGSSGRGLPGGGRAPLAHPLADKAAEVTDEALVLVRRVGRAHGFQQQPVEVR
jgi:beta-glucosidase